MKAFTDLLNAKIYCYSFNHRMLNRLAPRLKEVCQAFLGQKVLKTDGTLTQAFRKALEATIEETFRGATLDLNLGAMWCLSAKSFVSFDLTSWAHFDAPSSEGYFCKYFHSWIYLVDTSRGQIAESLSPELLDFQPYPEAYSKGKILETRERIKVLEKDIDSLDKSLYPFGRSDS